jgi:superfamily II DNA or RNA helicase
LWTYIDKANIDNYLIKYSQLANDFTNLSLYETEQAIFLPRLFYKNYPDGVQVYKGQNAQEPLKTYFKFTKKLRESQLPFIKCVLDIYNINKQVNGILKARPGLGKTVLSVYLASVLGLKTIVIVDTTVLMDQWVKAFSDFTDLKSNEIGIIKGKMCSLDTPITIAMVQTLHSKIKTDMHKNIRIIDGARYGLVFYDEVHATSSSSKYAKASLLFRTPNVIGLSATPFQTSTAEILMKNTIGEILYESKDYDVIPSYNLHFYNSSLGAKYGGYLRRITDYIKRKSFYNSIIIKSQEYLNIIISLIKLRQSEGHITMVLCSTKAQIQLISDKLIEEKIAHRRFFGDEKDEIDQINTNLMVATYSFAGKGFDFDRLSNLIYAINLAGKKSLIQTIGRVVRLDNMNPNKKSVIDDLVDLDFASIFIPDVKAKKKVVKDEFNCEINELKDGIPLTNGEI